MRQVVQNYKTGELKLAEVTPGTMFSSLLRLNERISAAMLPYLPQARFKIFDAYAELVGRLMNAKPGQFTVDVGGGARCLFATLKNPQLKGRIIALDMAEDRLRANRDVDDKIVADATRVFPFAPESVDLVVSKSVLEHLRDVGAFVFNTHRVLKKGGFSVNVFPCRFAPYATLNRILPKGLADKVLDRLHPESKGICGFPAYYDRCSPSQFRRVLEQHGFEIVQMRLSYSQSTYFRFFVPFFLASAAYEFVVRLLELEELCSYVLVVARKPTNARMPVACLSEAGNEQGRPVSPSNGRGGAVG